MWTYSDGARTTKGYWRPGGTARAGNWVLVDQATGSVQGVVPAGEFSRRFRPVDAFADVRPGLADAGRLHAAQRATAEQRASFGTLVAQRGLNARSLAAGLAPGTPTAP
jgi:hypothetical protein